MADAYGTAMLCLRHPWEHKDTLFYVTVDTGSPMSQRQGSEPDRNRVLPPAWASPGRGNTGFPYSE